MYSAHLKLPAALQEEDISKVSGALDDISDALAVFREDNNDDKPWVLQWIFQEKPDEKDLSERLLLMATINHFPEFEAANQEWLIEELPQENWLEYSYKQFPPFSVGPFFVYGSHYEGDVPEGQMGLQVDAATAFGSGEHETTKGCLMAMLDLKGLGVCPWQVLDMGTGSGILAIAAWKLWKTPIFAVDNDAEAVRVTTRHLLANGITSSPSNVLCKIQDGFGAREVKDRGPYELIIANILAGPLIEMSIDVLPLLDDNGYLILSGILNEQADDVLSAYEALDLTLKKRYKMTEWTTLVLQN